MRRLYLFALCLVIYEFTTYSANDMIMPGMLKVIADFHASINYVAFSLSFYILGNCCFILPGGFLAERFGKRKVMIMGNLLFLIFTVLIIFSHSIAQFMTWRFLQGGGLAIIAIGYALIHENFNDQDAIKLTALMSNVGILAPLIGPSLGSAIVSHSPWYYVFVVSTVLGTITLIGLYLFTPSKNKPLVPVKLNHAIKQYWYIIKNYSFLLGVISTVFGVLPLLLWITQAPNLILSHLHQDYLHFAVYQFISFAGLATSSLLMQFIAGKFRIYSLVKTGSIIFLIGIIICLIGTHNLWVLTSGFLIYGLGLGLVYGCVMRLILSMKNFSQAMLAAMFGFVQTLLMALSIILTNYLYSHFDFSMPSFTISIFGFGVIAFLLINKYIHDYRERAWE